MRRTRPRLFSIGSCLAVLISFFAVPGKAADTFAVEKAALAAPDEVAPAVRETLQQEALRVTGPKGALCEIWFRKALPVATSPSQELGVGYGKVAEGTLLGVMRILIPSSDYRQQRVKPGVYTMRYALHPVNGDHMGISPLRDFALLLPVALDTSPAQMAREDVFAQSKKAIGGNHPSVWSLASAEGAQATRPSVRHTDDSDLWILDFRVALEGAGGTLDMALVVSGHAPEA